MAASVPAPPKADPSRARAPASHSAQVGQRLVVPRQEHSQHVATTHECSGQNVWRYCSGDGPVELLETGPRTPTEHQRTWPSVARTSASRSGSPLSRASSRAARSSDQSLVGSTSVAEHDALRVTGHGQHPRV